MTKIDPQDLLSDLVTRALKAGADAADVGLRDSVSLSANVRLGETEKIERSETADLGLRVFVGKRQAMVGTTDRSPKALAELIDRAVAMARTVPEDPYTGLAAPDQLAREFPELDLCDPSEPSADSLFDLARRAEDTARAVPGITNSEGAGAQWGLDDTLLVASNGFSHRFRSSSAGISVAVIAAKGSEMERDDDWSSKRHLADLKSPEALGAKAAERALARLGGRKVPTAQVPVVFDPRASRTLVHHLASAISGSAIARGTSYLKDEMGKRVMPPGVFVIDDPHLPRGLRSTVCDGEGVANKRRAIIEDGVLTTWFLDLRSARQLGLTSTGHGSRGGGPSFSNLWLEPGAITAAELISDVKKGLYVTDLIGQGVNGVTGDYSRGAAGFWIENGEITYPVTEVTVAGNLKDMLRRVTAASDLELLAGIDAPTLRVDGMTVAGS
jgi:PmbA protein